MIAIPIRIVRYHLIRAVLQATLLVLAVFVGLDIFIRLLREFHQIGPQYDFWAALYYVLLRLPTDMYSLFPIIALIGSLLGMGSVVDGNELIVMRTSGMSLTAILIPVLIAIGALLLVIIFLGEGIGPDFNRLAAQHKAWVLSGGQALPMSPGVWIKEDNDFLYIQTVKASGELQDIYRYEFDNKGNLRGMVYADKGVFEKKRWVFYNVNRSNVNGSNVSVSKRLKEVWPLRFNVPLLTLAGHNPNQETLLALYAAIAYQNRGVGNFVGPHYRYAFWQRLLQPLSTVLMVVLAVPFMCGPLRSVTTGLRILIGLLWGFGFYLLNQLLASASVLYAISPLVVIVMPMLGLFVLWLAILRVVYTRLT